MRSLKDTIRDRELRQSGGHPESAAYHSQNYRRHFEGWSEYRETDAKGRTRIRRVYTGVYHRPALPDGRIRLLRAAYLLLWLVAAALFFLAATRPAQSNAAVYVTLPQALSLAALAWLLWALFNYVTAGHSMTAGEYRYAAAVRKAALFSAVCLAATAIATLAHLILNGGSPLGLLLFLAAALACGGIRLMESRLRYDSFLSDQTPPPDANQIAP